ncbi:BufA1 family periplasmic bufferin-type metallophore [Arhodomonas sp. AD133]|uniref:BufA1 family periplasmic bufferin-type metallophore n=1 Tax=Arhodomonas sp. AD133 TaxID=3415009 RepID=UPI003EBC89F9
MTRAQGVLYAAFAGAVALAATDGGTGAAEGIMEKCFGVAEAGRNDCATARNACAGTAEHDGLGHTFVVVPKGTCEKLVGGSLRPQTDESSEAGQNP